jgi:hypothetical protein
MKTTSARLTLSCLLPMAGLLLSACAADTARPADAREAPKLGDAWAHHVPVPGEAARYGGESGAGGAHFVYRGGPVISSVRIITVFWGANVANQSALDAFYGTIANSPYIDLLTEYDTPTQSIARGSFQTSYVDPSPPSGAQITDDQIQTELGQLIDQGAVPQPDANTLFMIHFPSGVTISMQSGLSCQQFCAYHSSFAHGGNNVYYGIIPDFSGGCSSCGGEPDQWGSTTVVSSHEVAEGITDPNIGVANQTQDEHQLGWYDDTYDEIADVCQGQSFTLDGYRVTKLWSNKASACVAAAGGSVGTGGGSTSSTSSTASGSTGSGDPGGGGGSCPHPICETGAPLAQSCGSCTNLVCAYDAHCCADVWDDGCVWEAQSFCGRRCQ